MISNHNNSIIVGWEGWSNFFPHLLGSRVFREGKNIHFPTCCRRLLEVLFPKPEFVGCSRLLEVTICRNFCREMWETETGTVHGLSV